MTRLNRRIFVLGGLATVGAAVLPLTSARAASPYPFKLGVASGEPAPDSVRRLDAAGAARTATATATTRSAWCAWRRGTARSR